MPVLNLLTVELGRPRPRPPYFLLDKGFHSSEEQGVDLSPQQSVSGERPPGPGPGPLLQQRGWARQAEDRVPGRMLWLAVLEARLPCCGPVGRRHIWDAVCCCCGTQGKRFCRQGQDGAGTAPPVNAWSLSSEEPQVIRAVFALFL